MSGNRMDASHNIILIAIKFFTTGAIELKCDGRYWDILKEFYGFLFLHLKAMKYRVSDCFKTIIQSSMFK
jgi:hypothetical protein